MQSGQELFRVIRDGEVEWQAELPEHALARVRSGAPVKVAVDGGGAVDATVRLVAPTIDARNRNGIVYVALPKDAPLSPAPTRAARSSSPTRRCRRSGARRPDARRSIVRLHRRRARGRAPARIETGERQAVSSR
jgi:hypothetical protein